jgi:PhnB protein
VPSFRNPGARLHRRAASLIYDGASIFHLFRSELMPTNYLPAGYHCVIPYLAVHDAKAAIDFYKKAFGAEEVMRMPHPDGRIAHAELKIGDAHIMLADEFPEMGARAPKTVGGTPVTIMIYVPNVDQVVERALAAGATLDRAVADQFYGDRNGGVTDPFGHKWFVATHVKDVTPAEMKAAMANS